MTDTAGPTGHFPRGTIVFLAVVTIATYGAWYYAFGVLLDPIIADTGWSEGWLSGTFSLSYALGGLGALPAGRLLDRVGARPVFVLCAGLSATGLGLASAAPNLPAFVAGGTIGGGALGALGFYHVTQTTAVRVAPDQPARAISLLTIWAAFSSTIYLPAAAVLVERVGWRDTLRVLAGVTVAILLVGAVMVTEAERPRRHLARTRLADTLRRPGVGRYVVAMSLAAMAMGIVLVYQVPIMTAAGLPLGTAAFMAGLRGAAQVTGRIPLPWLIARVGTVGAMRLAFVAITVGVGLLAVSSNVVVAATFAVVAGFGIGAAAPLQGIRADELFDRDQLGQSMGAMTLLFALAGSTGPVSVGVLNDLTDTRWWGVPIGLTCGIAAVALVSRRPDRDRPPIAGSPGALSPRTERGRRSPTTGRWLSRLRRCPGTPGVRR